MSFKSVVTHRSGMSMSTPSEHAPHWAEIICLHICLTSESGCLWKAEASGLAHVCTLRSTTWLRIHLHVHWRDQVKSHEEMLRASGKSLHHLQTSWRGHCDKKKSPLSPSILISYHINNFLHWNSQTPHKQFPTVQHKTSRRKTQCVFIQTYLAMKPSWKLTFYGTHLEKHCSRHTQFKPCHTQLWAPLWEFNRSCSIASNWRKASQLTFPAPTGPTTVNSSPGLTVNERPFRVGNSDSCKLKFIKTHSFQQSNTNYFRK